MEMNASLSPRTPLCGYGAEEHARQHDLFNVMIMEYYDAALCDQDSEINALDAEIKSLVEHVEEIGFETKTSRAATIEYSSQAYHLLQKGANQIKWIRDLTFVNVMLGEIIFSHYYSSSEAQSQHYFLAGVAIATALALPSERQRRRYLKNAKQMAEDAISIASEEPPLPIPNWAKQELGIDSD